MAVQGPPITAKLAASRCSVRLSRFNFDFIIQVFECFRNAAAEEEVINRLVMERRMQHPSVDAAEDFPSPDFRGGLRDSLIEGSGLSAEDADSVLNEITTFTRKAIDYEDEDGVELWIESVIFRVHKYVTLANELFQARRDALMAANNAVDDLIELKLHKECRSCSQHFSSEDEEEVVLMPCRKHVLHSGCAEEWCYQCPKCTFPIPNPRAERAGSNSVDGSGPTDDMSSHSNG